jgi:hypothetical protein
MLPLGLPELFICYVHVTTWAQEPSISHQVSQGFTPSKSLRLKTWE